jgi:glycosyltransferase involved in cell wall biosynthesis
MTTQIHPLTTAHRLPGGLCRLDFILANIASRSASLGRPLRIGLAAWRQGMYALPLADAGHEVTVIEADVRVRADALERAQEVGVTLGVMDASRLMTVIEPFDVILIDVTEGGDLKMFDEILRPHLAPHGRAIIAVPRGQAYPSWEAFRSWLAGTGYRMRELETFESGWIAVAAPCEPGRPLVIHLLPAFGMGGAERLVLDLSSGLMEKGFDVEVFGILDGGVLETSFADRGIPTRVFRRRDPFGISTVRDLVRMFRLERPAIVHTHLFGADAWGRLAAFLARVPTVISTEHNVNPSYAWIHRLVNRIFARKTKAVVAVSQAVKETSIERDHVSPEKIRVITNGIDMRQVIPRGAHGFHDVPRLITVGRLYPQKDHATLFKALALVKRPWRLSIAGDGPLRAELASLAQRLNIASRITWLGIRQDVPNLLATSDLFCFPSRWEGLGNAALEAAAAGLPVLLSDIPPLREAFMSSDALFAPPGDVPAWAHAISSILDDPGKTVTRAARAAPSIQAKYSLDTMVTRYAELYRSLV